jgi:hypothetical protein
MRWFYPGALALALALGAALGACGQSSSRGAPEDAGGDDAGGKTVAPTTLRAFESNAEGIGDACKASDFVKAQGVLGEANTNWPALKPQAQQARASADLVKRVDDGLAKIGADIAARLQRECEADANALTLAVPDLFDLFAFPVPSDALRGDGVFRALEIDGEYADFTLAAADLESTKTVWARLEPVTAAQAPKRPDIPGTETVVVDMGMAIQGCAGAIAAKDAAALQTHAQNGLDLIDTVETIFK